MEKAAQENRYLKPREQVMYSPTREEGRLHMKGSRVILALAALLLVFSVSTLRAQDEYCKPLDKTINPGVTPINFNAVTYYFHADGCFSVRFEKLDNSHVKVHIKPVKQEPRPYYEVGVQWGNFAGVVLDFNSPDGGGYTFDTETGYAEK
jgi:hypothetical protein